MEIVSKKVEDLIPYASNPRNNDGAVDAVAASIHEFGFKVPLVITKDNVIVTGHTRLKAAKKLGMECEQNERNAFMMELDPHYCDVIIKRWEDFTGKKAVLING